MDKIDRTKLSVDELAKLEQYEFNLKQVKRFKDIQGILEEVAGSLADASDTSEETAKKFGALLTDIRESLSSLNKKEAPESPDYAKPVVEELKKLETALSKAIKGIDTKPQVNVAAPQVKVEPKIDLKGVEKVLKDMPSAFEKAIKLIPKAPENKDYTEQFDQMLEQLASIDVASRMKPQFPLTQLNAIRDSISTVATGSGLATSSYALSNLDDTTSTEYYGYENASGAWYIKKVTSTAITFVAGASNYSTAWTDRATQTYASYKDTF